jgi:cell division protein FtsQ
VEAGDTFDTRPRVTIQRSPKNRPIAWDDDVPTEPRFRRVQQVTPQSGRNLPGMPLTMPDPEDDDLPRATRQRFDGPAAPWWRPATKWGRIFLGIGALAVLATLVVAFEFSKTYLERDARFRITGSGDIQATGLGEVTRVDILPVFGEDIGRNIFFVPLSQRRKQLEKIPWVERASVMRLLPDQLRVQVVERQPVAFVREGQQIELVDANGVLLSMPAASMTKHHYSFPVVTGIDAADPLAARRARMAVYERLIGDLDSTGQHLSEQLSEIDLTDPEDARVVMPEQGADILAHFGEDQFLARYQRYKAHIAEWRQQYPRLMAVDLRYDQQVVLKMAPGAGGGDIAQTDARPKTLIDPTQATAAAPVKPSAGVKAAAAKVPSARRSKAAAHKVPAKAKSISAKEKKRREEARRAAMRRPKPTHNTPHPAAGNGQGQ